jgi:hypothetical protein
MKKSKKHKQFDLGRLFAAIVFVVLMFGLVLFTVYYDPDKQFSNSFFEDISNAIQWR